MHWWSWREIFFVNVPVGLVALWMSRRYMPEYRSDSPRPLDVIGLVLFSSGAALLSWLLEVFGEHRLDVTSSAILFLLAFALLGAYGFHANRTEYPLLNLRLFKVRTFRVSVLGGLVTRLGIGGLPFLLPLFYQLGMGMPAWQSGLMMMPSAHCRDDRESGVSSPAPPLRLSTRADREHRADGRDHRLVRARGSGHAAGR